MTLSGAGTGLDYQPLDRFNAFSDGVFAIVITLLVLELPVPPMGAPVPQGLSEAWPDFLGYFISFAYVGGIWLSHAALTRLMKRGDDLSFRLNLVMLLFVSLLPFTTKVMVAHMTGPDARFAVAEYGLDVLIASGLLTALMWYAARDRHLMLDDVADDKLRRSLPPAAGGPDREWRGGHRGPGRAEHSRRHLHHRGSHVHPPAALRGAAKALTIIRMSIYHRPKSRK